MSELPGRVARAFRDHDAFERDDDDGATFRATATPFEGLVTAAETDDGEVRFDVTVRVPMLDEVTEDEVAEVVEEGWYETFERRIGAIGGGVTQGQDDLSPDAATAVRDGTHVAEVTASFTDIDPRRGVNDAAAVVDFVEGTFVQGVIPGYDYTEPVTGILSKARRAGDSDAA